MRERPQDWAEKVEGEDAERTHLVVSEMRLVSLRSSQTVYKKVAIMKSGCRTGAAFFLPRTGRGARRLYCKNLEGLNARRQKCHEDVV